MKTRKSNSDAPNKNVVRRCLDQMGSKKVGMISRAWAAS